MKENTTGKFSLKFLGTDVSYERSEKFLQTELPRLLAAVAESYNERVKSNLSETLEGLQRDFVAMDGGQANVTRLNKDLAYELSQFHNNLTSFLADIEQLSAQPELLAAAVKAIEDTTESFKLQYLRLQPYRDHENRQYTMVSNLMKTLQDTVANSISNIR